MLNKLYRSSSLCLPPTYLRSLIERNRTIPKCDIIYSVSNFYLGELPWVIDCEDARTFYQGFERLFYFHKACILKVLHRKNCKKILPWTEAAKKSILLNYKSKKISEKIDVVPLTIKSIPVNLNKKFKSINFLFIGSINPTFQKDFYYKGGLETIIAFKKIVSKYDNINLIIRSYVDEKIQKIINKSKNIILLNNILKQEELYRLYETSSVLVYPSFVTPGLTFTEAMNFGLPIITTNYWANPEYVIDNFNGFLITLSKTVKKKEIIKNTLSYSRNIGYHKVDDNQIEELCDKLEYFIQYSNEISRMGKNSKYLLTDGKFSLEKKNFKLKEIYEYCLKK
jgi:glycosyltransferase involved in cell wall biosynthesis